jgi:hypothetical protein
MNEQSKSNPNSQGFRTPDLDDLEDMLKSIQPNPTSRFYQQMEAQPWNKRGRIAWIQWLNYKQLPSTLGLLFLIFLIFSLSVPSLNALARRIAEYFIPAPKDTISIQVPADEIFDLQTEPSFSIAEASLMVDFQVRIPGALPEGYSLLGAGYNPKRGSISLTYQSTEGDVLRITERPVGADYQTISVNAIVERVQIGELFGEYVKGGWKTSRPRTVISTMTVEAEWDSDANIHFLRWRDKDILFEIISSGDDQLSPFHLSKTDLIAIAESMQ